MIDAIEKVSAESIMQAFKDRIEDKQPIAPSWWLDGASKLIVFWGDMADAYAKRKTEIAEIKVSWISQGKSVAEASVHVEATLAHQEMLQLKAKMDQITEFVRLAKQRARLASWEEGFND